MALNQGPKPRTRICGKTNKDPLKKDRMGGDNEEDEEEDEEEDAPPPGKRMSKKMEAKLA